MEQLAVKKNRTKEEVTKDLEEVEISAEYIVLTSQTSLDEKCRGDAVAGAHSPKHEGLLHVLRVPSPRGDSRGLLGGVGQAVVNAHGV